MTRDMLITAIKRASVSIAQEAHWHPDYQTRALADGWGVFETDNGPLEIQRFDSMARFNSDEEARAYVTEQAELGNAVARAALKTVHSITFAEAKP